MDAFLAKLIESGTIIAFLVWLFWFIMPYLDKWVNRWMSEINNKFADSRSFDAQLLANFHYLDKKLENMQSSIETIQIILNMKPDRRKTNEDLDDREKNNYGD